MPEKLRDKKLEELARSLDKYRVHLGDSEVKSWLLFVRP